MKILEKVKKGYNDICEKTSYALSHVTKDQIETAFGIAGIVCSVCVGHATGRIVDGVAPKDEKVVGKIVTAIGVTMISSALSTAAMKEINSNCDSFIKEIDNLGYFKEETEDE